jgi:hypothetical protein
MGIGKGKNPKTHLMKLALQAKLSKKWIDAFIDQMSTSLNRWHLLDENRVLGLANVELVARALVKIGRIY